MAAYQICDKINTKSCTIAPVIVKVPALKNNAPAAVNDSSKTLMNQKLVVDVLANDSDPDSDILVIEKVENPENGDFVIEDRKITFTPRFGFTGEATASYTVNDGKGGTSSARVLILVEKTLNQPPVAVNDSALINMNTTAVIDALKNDSDPENDTITLQNVSVVNGESGTASIKNGKVEFIAQKDFVGQAILSYTIRDSEGGIATAVIIIRVVDNTAPTANDDVANILKNETFVIDALANDTDDNTKDKLVIEKVENQQNGVFTIIDNKIQIVPTHDFVGEARATYTVFDGVNGRATADVIVTVSETIPPIAVDDTKTTAFNTPIDIAVLENDSDPRHHPLSITAIQNEQNGHFSIVGNQVHFVPNQDFVGQATARYTIDNGYGGTASASITVTVEAAPLPPPPKNQPPIAKSDSVETLKNTEITIAVLENDSDPEKDTLSITSVNNQENGTFRVRDDKIVFVPQRDFLGNASAIYTISDGKDGVAMATIIVRVFENTIPQFIAEKTLSRSKFFTKNNCQAGENTAPVEFSHTITKKYISQISQEDANQKAHELAETAMNADFERLGQEFANTNGVCTAEKIYTVTDSLNREAMVSRDNCGDDTTTTPVKFVHTINKTVTSKVSEADAREKLALILENEMNRVFATLARNFANANGVCTQKPSFTVTDELSREKSVSRNNCEAGTTTRGVTFVRKIKKSFTSYISEADAKAKLAEILEQEIAKDFDTLAQEYANVHGVCEKIPTPNPPSSGGGGGGGNG